MNEEERSRKQEVRDEMRDTGRENRDLGCEISDMRYGTRVGIQQNIGGFNIDDIVNATLEKERLAEIERKRSKMRDVKGKNEPEQKNPRSQSTMYRLEELDDSYQVVKKKKKGEKRYYFLKEPYKCLTSPG